MKTTPTLNYYPWMIELRLCIIQLIIGTYSSSTVPCGQCCLATSPSHSNETSWLQLFISKNVNGMLSLLLGPTNIPVTRKFS